MIKWFLIILTFVSGFGSDALGTPRQNVFNLIDRVQSVANQIVNERNKISELNDIANGSAIGYYIFVMSMHENNEGEILYHANPRMIGQNIMDFKEPGTRTLIGYDVLDAADSKENKGWVQYRWKIPFKNKIMVKTSYIVNIPEKKMAVCGGIYGITLKEVRKILKQEK